MNFLSGLKVVQIVLSLFVRIMDYLKIRELKDAGRAEERDKSSQEALKRNEKIKRIYADPDVDPRWLRHPDKWDNDSK